MIIDDVTARFLILGVRNSPGQFFFKRFARLQL
jgi:hypothetical protein